MKKFANGCIVYNMSLKTLRLDQGAIEMFISEFENKGSLCKVMSQIYNKREVSKDCLNYLRWFSIICFSVSSLERTHWCLYKKKYFNQKFAHLYYSSGNSPNTSTLSYSVEYLTRIIFCESGGESYAVRWGFKTHCRYHYWLCYYKNLLPWEG